MNRVYKFCGGRKMFVFFFMLLVGATLSYFNAFKQEFSTFSLSLAGMLILGNVGSKFASKTK
jgi:hypothetical protein